MTDKNAHQILEEIGDSKSPAELAEFLSHMEDLPLGKIAGIGQVLRDVECGGAKEASGETDGTCKVYNAAVNEYDHRRAKGDTPTR